MTTIDIDWRHTAPDWAADYDDLIKDVNEYQTLCTSL